MLKIYCKKCGSPTNYSLNKPKFCSGCGNSFQENISASNNNTKEIKKIEPIITKTEILDHDDFDDDNIENIDISKINLNSLNVEYSKEESPNIKIKDLVGTSSGGNSLRKTKTKKSKISKKQFLEDFQKEAGTLRKKYG